MKKITESIVEEAFVDVVGENVNVNTTRRNETLLDTEEGEILWYDNQSTFQISKIIQTSIYAYCFYFFCSQISSAFGES